MPSKRALLVSLLALLVLWPVTHLLSLNYLGLHLFPRRAQRFVTLPPELKDRGVFEDLNEGLEIPIPSWLPVEGMSLSRRGKLVALNYGDHVLALFSWGPQGFNPDDEALLSELLGERFLLAKRTLKRARPHPRLWRDKDGDQIPDSLDVHLGLLKVLKNRACYNKQVHGVSYPMGDVPREVGVCTDVAVRSYRNAGFDLQRLVYQDMQRAPQAYGLTGPANRGYEHRRVRRLFPYFKRSRRPLSLDSSLDTSGRDAWLPGDLLFMSFTPGEGRPDHVGLVSGHVQLSGYPLLAHNAATGFCVGEHDTLFAQPLLGRFRLTGKR